MGVAYLPVKGILAAFDVLFVFEERLFVVEEGREKARTGSYNK